MRNLFAYGTLVCDDIMAEVSGAHLSSASATLRGYRRRRVKGEVYPALVSDAESRVDGVVYWNVPPSAWARLDRFEGERYSREVVCVELDNGAVVSAATYVARPEFMDYLDEAEWDSSEFLRKDKGTFCKSFIGYRALQ